MHRKAVSLGGKSGEPWQCSREEASFSYLRIGIPCFWKILAFENHSTWTWKDYNLAMKPVYHQVQSSDYLLWLFVKNGISRTSLVVQWLGLRTPNAGRWGSIPGQGTGSHVRQLGVHRPQLKIPQLQLRIPLASHVPQLGSVQPNEWVVNSPPAMRETQETQVRSLGREGSLEEGMATHSSILPWRVPRTEEPGGLQSTGSQRAGQGWSELALMQALYICNGILKETNPKAPRTHQIHFSAS